jgi:hypothetical protein
MRKKQSEIFELNVFGNGNTLQTCIRQPLAKKLKVSPGSRLAVEVADADQTVNIKKGMAVMYVHEPETILQ